jgi:hypothetical protein
MGGNQTAGVVATYQNLLMLEVRTRYPDLQSLGKKDVVELFHGIGLKDYDKVILHNNISGKDLMTFTEKSIQSIFGIREKSHSVVRIMDEIEVKRSTICHPPCLFLLGNNYNGLFGKDGNLNHYCEVSPPVFDVNEEISGAEIASYNVVLTTNKHRSFISMKREALDDPKRRKSSTKNDQDDADSPKNKKDAKNKPKKDKKGKGDKSKKKDNEKQSSKPPKNQTEWVCLEDLLERHWGSHFGENDHVYRAQGTGGYFNTIIAESPTERIRPFETAAAFLTFIKRNKVFEPDNILFCAESINKYYIYDEILASPQLLKDIRIIKRKSDHLALWSKYNPTFDVRRNLV